MVECVSVWKSINQMQSALLILALLVHTVYSYSTTRAETLKLFNSARSLIAKNTKVANMIQLEYSPALEDILYVKLGKTGGCSDSKIIHDEYNSRIHVEAHLNVNTETMDQQSFSKLFGGADKQVMAHVETKCMETGKENSSFWKSINQMKTALLVLVLLVHTVYSSSSTRVEILELFHSARSSIAKNAHIANMIQLEYQSELENILYVKLGKSGGCSDSKTIYDNYGSRILVEIHLNVNTETMDQQSFSKLFGGADKQVMAHVETKCMETGKEVHSYVFYKTGEHEIHGPPGSQCPRGSRTTSDGPGFTSQWERLL
ncbi:hypothetical protein L3Y34_009727 [Caenorhabditis briggsae]|uniref:Uncharacterized protein n=1 Tax=Caenorhabditis briggsae TaxID=6238 RepID=A0AAE9A7V1_CAEBR|nr:hypothetical protein L3Y34_009727 [Caenorhabditis briggsae]